MIIQNRVSTPTLSFANYSKPSSLLKAKKWFQTPHFQRYQIVRLFDSTHTVTPNFAGIYDRLTNNNKSLIYFVYDLFWCDLRMSPLLSNPFTDASDTTHLQRKQPIPFHSFISTWALLRIEKGLLAADYWNIGNLPSSKRLLGSTKSLVPTMTGCAWIRISQRKRSRAVNCEGSLYPLHIRLTVVSDSLQRTVFHYHYPPTNRNPHLSGIN